VLALEGQTTP